MFLDDTMFLILVVTIMGGLGTRRYFRLREKPIEKVFEFEIVAKDII